MVISEIYPHLKNFSSNWLTVQFFSENANLTEFLQKIVGKKLSNYHTCTLWHRELLHELSDFLAIQEVSYLVKLYSNTIAWSPIGRHMVFATRGSHFFPRGEAPRDEMAPKGLQKLHASQSAIMQLYCYRVYKKKKSAWISCWWFHKF